MFNVGIMGFAALGGAAAVIVSKAPVTEAWRAGGGDLLGAVLACAATIAAVVFIRRYLGKGPARTLAVTATIVAGSIGTISSRRPCVRT